MSANIWNPSTGGIALSNLNRVYEEFIATAGQTDFALTITPYTFGANNLEVFKNGLKVLPSVVTETSTGQSFSLAACANGDRIEAVVFPGTAESFNVLAAGATASAAASLASASAAAASAALAATFSAGWQAANNVWTGLNNFSALGLVTSNLNGGPLSGLRNLILNGGMRLDQRNSGAAVTLNTTALIYTADRWAFGWVAAAAVGSAQRVAGQLPLSPYALALTISTASTPSGNQTYNLQQRIEGFNCEDLLWGTASAKPVTVSFRVQSSVVGTYSGAIQNGAQNRSYPFTYTISQANTPTNISVTIPGEVTGTWAADNTTGMTLCFDLGGAGTSRGAASVWAAAGYFGVTGTVNLVATLGANFRISEVQLEIGSTATPFESRPYGLELALCQRYLPCVQTAIGSHVGQAISTTDAKVVLKFPVQARVAPTGAIVIGGTLQVVTANFGAQTGTANAFFAGAVNSGSLSVTGGSGLVAGSACCVATTTTIIWTGCEL